jgi:hypothetical protein
VFLIGVFKLRALASMFWILSGFKLGVLAFVLWLLCFGCCMASSSMLWLLCFSFCALHVDEFKGCKYCCTNQPLKMHATTLDPYMFKDYILGPKMVGLGKVHLSF